MQGGLGRRMAKVFMNMKIEDVTRAYDEVWVKM
jgi:hypothetical protein